MLHGKDTTREQYGRRLGLGAAFQLVGVITQQVLRFLSNWLIAHLFGPGVMGLYSLSFITWSAAEMSFSGGMLRGVMRHLPHHLARDEHPEAKGAVRIGLYGACFGGLGLGALLYLLADPIAIHVLHKPQVAPILRIFAFITPLEAFSEILWTTARALGSFTFIVYQFMLLPALTVLFVVCVAWVGGDVRLLAWGLLLAYLLPLVPLWGYHRRLMRFLDDVKPRLLWVPFLTFAGVNMLMWAADFGARNIDLVLVGRLRTLAEAGVYGVATRNATTCSTVMISINAFFMPTISSLYAAGRMDDFRDIFRKGTLWILIVGAPLAIFVMAFAEPAMTVFGRHFTSGAWALWLLALAQLVNQGTGLIGSALLMSNRQNSVLLVSTLGMAVTFGLCELLIPIYGLNGAAMAMSVTVVFVNLTLSLWGYAKLRLSPFSPSYFKPLLAAAVAGVVSQFVVGRLPLISLRAVGQHQLRQALVMLALGAVIFGTLYVLGMWVLGAKQEATTALRAVRSGLNRRNRTAAEEEQEA